jgi:hypothetical protein
MKRTKTNENNRKEFEEEKFSSNSKIKVNSVPNASSNSSNAKKSNKACCIIY